jgi:hypothetical protein
MMRSTRFVPVALAALVFTNTIACGAMPAPQAPSMPAMAAPVAAPGGPQAEAAAAPAPMQASASMRSSAAMPAVSHPAPPSASPQPATKAGETSPSTAHGNAKGKEISSEARSLVIYTGQLAMLTEAEKGPQTIDRIIDVAESLGGGLLGRRDDGVDIRVPSQSFRSALKELEGVAPVTARSVQAQDVSEQVHDLEVRLSNLKATQKRLQEFLARAAGVNDALTVERELERVAQEIDTIEGKVGFLKTRASFSTITVAVREKPKPVAPLVVAPPPPEPPKAKPPAQLPDLPVAWLDKLGIGPLLTLKKN